jgi:phosphatidylserine/phosphatidylglycerophosphate/cardiolipin synthase-like enzyme
MFSSSLPVPPSRDPPRKGRPQAHRSTVTVADVVETAPASLRRLLLKRPLRLATLWRVQNRSHVRAFVIDGRVGWTAGFGVDDKWLRDGRTNGAWRETNVGFTGPAVLQLQAAFAAAWSEASGVLFTGRATPTSPRTTTSSAC